MGIITREEAVKNLSSVTVKGRDILDAAIKDACADKMKIINEAFKEALDNPISVEELANNPAVGKLSERYHVGLDLVKPDNGLAFADGGGDKAGPEFESTRIVFGTLIYDISQKKFLAYRYALQRGGSFDWLFRASNVAGEELAALFSLYAAQKMGLKQLHIYQDNNLPAKYFSGEFKKIHNADDYMLQIFVNASISYLKWGMDIKFLYVPSEHACQASSAKAKKGRTAYEAQQINKLPFETAEFLNGVSDVLADYRV